jgi:hypothetical protein
MASPMSTMAATGMASRTINKATTAMVVIIINLLVGWHHFSTLSLASLLVGVNSTTHPFLMCEKWRNLPSGYG